MNTHFVVTWYESVGGVYTTLDAALKDRENWGLDIDPMGSSAADDGVGAGPHELIKITQWLGPVQLAQYDYLGNKL